MSDKPLIIDEPVATGWLRSEYHGDQDKAKGYALAARKVLGGMRSMYGVNDRIANGEGGGYYKQAVQLADGTRIEAITNDGVDAVRIYASSSADSSSEEFTPEFASTAFDGEKTDWTGKGEHTGLDGAPTSSEFTPEWGGESLEWPLEILPVYETYLWIGVRQLDNRYDPGLNNEADAVTLHCCVFEPFDPDTGEIAVLSNQWRFSDRDGWDASVTPLRPNRMRAGLVHPETGEQYGDLYYTSRCFYLVDRHAPTYDANKNLIFDPWPDEPDNPVEWDFVFVLDPYEGWRITPQDPSDVMLTMPGDDRDIIPDDAMSAETGNDGVDKILKGIYALKIMAAGDDCNQKPTRVQIEVMTWKFPTMSREKFFIDIAGNTQLARGILPGGYNPSETDPCSSLGGPNPHRDHWWQGAILTSPDGGTELVEAHIPEWGFDPGAGWPSQAVLCESDASFNRYAYTFQYPVQTRAVSIVLQEGEFHLFPLPAHYDPPQIWAYELQAEVAPLDIAALAAFLHDCALGGINILSNQSGAGRTSAADVLAALPATFAASYGTQSLGTLNVAGSGWTTYGTTGGFDPSSNENGIAAWVAAFGIEIVYQGTGSNIYIYDGLTNTTTDSGMTANAFGALQDLLRTMGFTHHVYSGGLYPDSGVPTVAPLYAPQDGGCA